MGQGTTFHIFLPIQAGAAIAEPEDSNSDALHDFTGRERILLVEDSAAVRAVAATVLRDAGYEVVEAESGAEALSLLEGEEVEAFDLLFTDVMMPGGIFGGELAKRVRALFPDIRVLFASGYPRQALSGSAGLVIDIDLLAKPYDDVALLRKVREVLTSEPRAL